MPTARICPRKERAWPASSSSARAIRPRRRLAATTCAAARCASSPGDHHAEPTGRVRGARPRARRRQPRPRGARRRPAASASAPCSRRRTGHGSAPRRPTAPTPSRVTTTRPSSWSRTSSPRAPSGTSTPRRLPGLHVPARAGRPARQLRARPGDGDLAAGRRQPRPGPRLGRAPAARAQPHPAAARPPDLDALDSTEEELSYERARSRRRTAPRCGSGRRSSPCAPRSTPSSVPTALTLSGGLRQPLAPRRPRRCRQGGPCVTWGLAASLADPRNDAAIARRLAGRFGMPHEYSRAGLRRRARARACSRASCAPARAASRTSAATPTASAPGSACSTAGTAAILRGDCPGWGSPYAPISETVARSINMHCTLVSRLPRGRADPPPRACAAAPAGRALPA